MATARKSSALAPSRSTGSSSIRSLEAYEAFSRGAETQALKVVVAA
jgi:hypothetical protein